MTDIELMDLQEGDTVVSNGSGLAYLVIHRRVITREIVQIIAIRTIDVSNPSEWTLAKPDTRGRL